MPRHPRRLGAVLVVDSSCVRGMERCDVAGVVRQQRASRTVCERGGRHIRVCVCLAFVGGPALQTGQENNFTVSCEEWLRRSGLAIEPDKTELLFFQKPYERNAIPAPTRLILPDPAIQSYYVVLPVENLRYLGFFINRRLKWEHHVRIMCNWARASIKALQVLGNSIRGLSMANWRLVLNAVCLPVLAYGSQLWYLTGAAKGLINMVQRVQNDMVKQVTGAFRTAPRGALLHFTRMIPMKYYIEKLTYTSALRLYRLPRASQLLRRLGPDWYVPSQGDLPLPVPRSRVLPGKRNQRPTALEALAQKVPSEGPRVDVVAIAPWEAPNWVEHVSFMGVENPFIRKTWVCDLTEVAKGTSTMLIHLACHGSDGKVPDSAVMTTRAGSILVMDYS
jgi:hypothetical protein